ncbi:monooxygenase FAD-binding protein [Pilatotrama ljubarskyi]|nr:monooxygenase FAD-binding protein [Pilatotrama ljubarskyi]
MTTNTPTSSNASQPSIAIIGGGPAGLVLLLTLQKRGVSATLYEREEDREARGHLGGTLDLEWDSGQRALRENGLEEAFKKVARRNAEAMKMIWKDGRVLFAQPGARPTDPLEKSRPEIDRRTLRDLLLDALPDASAIKWGHALSSIRSLGDGKHELTFSNGLVTVADFVVGADGAHSRVRPLLSPAVPLYHGVNGVEISLAPDVIADPANDDINEGVGEGCCYVIGDAKILAFQRNGSGRIRTYAWHRAPLDWSLPRDPTEAKKALQEMFAGFAPWMLKFIQLCDESAIYPRPLFYLPVGHRWPHTPGVTIIGDAAHLQSPWGGWGANVSMRDGLDLGIAIADAVKKGLKGEEWEEAIKAWEESMFERVVKFTSFSYNSLEESFTDDDPDTFMAKMAKYGPDEGQDSDDVAGK